MMKHTVVKDWITPIGLRAVILKVDVGLPASIDSIIPNSWMNGYVAIEEDHPLYGLDYNVETSILNKAKEIAKSGVVGNRGILDIFCMAYGDQDKDWRLSYVVDVHGSLSYSGGDGKYPVPGDGLWWYGFDCNHSSDMPHFGGHSKSEEFVETQCCNLADQLFMLKSLVPDEK